MKVGLVQIDGKLPNLALMKICGYNESIGNEVEWFMGNLFESLYDKIYASKLFDFSILPPLPQKTILGGTGIDFYNKLDGYLEASIPSYSLYPDCFYHVGFSMKGCRFNCSFCCVPKKEGRPYLDSNIDEILINPNGENRLMLLDNDFFGGENWKINLERIIELKLKVCFVQGLNIRIITAEQAELLSVCNYYSSKFTHRYLTFAWDKYKDRKIVLKGVDICNKAGIPSKNMQFFILIGYDTTPEQDMERIETIRAFGALPFVMPYDKKNSYQKSLTRWVNHRAIFKTVKWKDYKHRVETA